VKSWNQLPPWKRKCGSLRLESKDSFEPIGCSDNRSYQLCKKFDKLNLMVVTNMEVTKMELAFTLLCDIQKDHLEDEKIYEIKRNIKKEKLPGFTKK
jgi:hypothetical protein